MGLKGEVGWVQSGVRGGTCQAPEGVAPPTSEPGSRWAALYTVLLLPLVTSLQDPEARSFFLSVLVQQEGPGEAPPPQICPIHSHSILRTHKSPPVLPHALQALRGQCGLTLSGQ